MFDGRNNKAWKDAKGVFISFVVQFGYAQDPVGEAFQEFPIVVLSAPSVRAQGSVSLTVD